MALSGWLFTGCIYASDDADDSQGSLAVGNYWGEPAGDNNSLYNEINNDLANSSIEEILEMIMADANSGDTDDTDNGGNGGAVCDELADCMCPMSGDSGTIAECYDAVSAMTESECQSYLDMYSEYC
jgi:hypothetical protein